MVKNPPAVQKTQVQSLGQEDPQEEVMEIYSSTLGWRLPTERGAWQATGHRVEKSWTLQKRLSQQVIVKKRKSKEMNTEN